MLKRAIELTDWRAEDESALPTFEASRGLIRTLKISNALLVRHLGGNRYQVELRNDKAEIIGKAVLDVDESKARIAVSGWQVQKGDRLEDLLVKIRQLITG